MFKLNTVQIDAAVGVKRKGGKKKNLSWFQISLEILMLNPHRSRGRGEVRKSHLRSKDCSNSSCWVVWRDKAIALAGKRRREAGVGLRGVLSNENDFELEIKEWVMFSGWLCLYGCSLCFVTSVKSSVMRVMGARRARLQGKPWLK